MASSKILTLEEAKALPAWPRALCLGCFDPFHVGHLRHFQAAKQFGQLVVAVTVDSRVNKGPNRPMFTLQDRMEVVAALEEVSYVVPNEDAVAVIQAVKPRYYVKGSEYRDKVDPTGGIDEERVAVEAVGGQLVFTDEPTASSSEIVRRVSGENADWIREHKIGMSDVNRFESVASQLRVLVVGEFIEDRYIPCRARHLQVKHKGPSLDVLAGGTSHCGGAYAVARHVRPWVKSTTLLTGMDMGQLMLATSDIGTGSFDKNSVRDLAQFSSGDGSFHLVSGQVKQGMTKTRYVDGDHDVVQVNTCDDLSMASHHLHQWMTEQSGNAFDVVIVADFGHGLISSDMVKWLLSHRTAVMAQTNTSNFGFNRLNRYAGAGMMACNKLEADLSQGRELMAGWAEALARDLCEFAIVTKGADGSEMYSRKSNASLQVPRFQVSPRDVTGAGDAFLALSSVAAHCGCSMPMIGMLGSVAGAIATTFKGNERGVQQHEMLKYLRSLCP